ncbi:MAG: hypothetical protein EF813_06375 [Methanosarcinales archaeon]|nr:MAG: hypothetical protein EF813_06375 [Methanosarcinales archaeon]
MEQMTHKTVMIISLALMLAVGAVQVSVAAVTVAIDDCTAATGGEVTVPIRIASIANYGAGTINITYDPGAVHITGISNSDDSTVTPPDIDNTAGIASVSAWNLAGVSGDIVFADVTLTAVGSEGGSSTLTLDLVKMVNTSMKPIEAGVSDGTFMITGGSGDATPTSTPEQGSGGQSPSQLTPPLPDVVMGAESGSEPDESPDSAQPEEDHAEPADTAHAQLQTASGQVAPGSGIVSISLSILLGYLILTWNTKRGGGR